jgi:hypothetical protein
MTEHEFGSERNLNMNRIFILINHSILFHDAELSTINERVMSLTSILLLKSYLQLASIQKFGYIIDN